MREAVLTRIPPQRKEAFLERRRPTEVKQSITEIDPNKYRELGVTTLFLDGDGTFIEHDGWNVDQEVIEKITSFREAGFENVVIVTNKKPKDECTFVKLNYWAHQIGADLVFIPETKRERKPHPDLLLKAAARLGVEPRQVLMVGDKLTADIQAANDAGMYSGFVAKRGKKDLWGDQKLRRPLEAQLLEEIEALDTQFQLRRSPRYTIDDLPEYQSLPAWMDKIDSRLIERSKIVNLGPQRAASIEVEGKLFPGLRRAIKHHYYEHGRTHADVATKMRRVAGNIAGGLILGDRIREARGAVIVGKLTDVYDGPCARSHKYGATPEGGVADYESDRANTRSTVLPAVVKGRVKARHPIARMLGDEIMKLVRDHYRSRGVDTKAGWPGKGAAFFEDVSEVSMLTERNPELLQYAADVVKILRVPAYMVLWEMKARKLDREKSFFEEAKKALLSS